MPGIISRRSLSLILFLALAFNVWHLSRRSSGFHLTPIWSDKDSNEGPKSNAHADSRVKVHSTQTAPTSATSRRSSASSRSGAISLRSSSTPVPPEKDIKSIPPEFISRTSSPATSTSSAPRPLKALSTEYESGMGEIKQILHKMAEGHPKDIVLNKYDRNIKKDTKLQRIELPLTDTVLGMYLQVTEEERERLKAAHAKALEAIAGNLPTSGFKGRGIVTTGGGTYFPMVMHLVKWVREIDPNIPIEIFLKDDNEWEKKLCDDAFPALNVRCRVVEDIFGKDMVEKASSSYALKPLAILASQFKEVYFLDADCLPLDHIDRVFKSTPFEDTGYVLNSDLWARTISPHYYDVANITLGGRVKGSSSCPALLQCDRENAIACQSTESGAIAVDKSRHLRSLLLATFYNIFGEEVYYPLIMQDSNGAGDKDTFVPAATILGESYYQTSNIPSRPGAALLQPDPQSDYDKYALGKEGQIGTFNLHVGSVKANPRYMLQDHDDHVRGVPALKRGRYIGSVGTFQGASHRSDDVELHYFQVMADITCDWVRERGWIPRDWEGQDYERMCGLLVGHVSWLREHPEASWPWDDKNAVFAIDEAYPTVERGYKSVP